MRSARSEVVARPLTVWSVVEAEVEDGVHHPRHRWHRPDTDEQRIGGIAEFLLPVTPDMREAGGDLVAQALRTGHPSSARPRKKSVEIVKRPLAGPAGRSTPSGEVGALAAEQVLSPLAAIRTPPPKRHNILGHRRSLLSACFTVRAKVKYRKCSD
jgi:hypothetical protein